MKWLFILVDYIVKYVPDSTAVRAVMTARELCLATFFIINKTDLRLDPYKDFNTILLADGSNLNSSSFHDFSSSDSIKCCTFSDFLTYSIFDVDLTFIFCNIKDFK